MNLETKGEIVLLLSLIGQSKGLNYPLELQTRNGEFKGLNYPLELQTRNGEFKGLNFPLGRFYGSTPTFKGIIGLWLDTNPYKPVNRFVFRVNHWKNIFIFIIYLKAYLSCKDCIF